MSSIEPKSWMRQIISVKFKWKTSTIMNWKTLEGEERNVTYWSNDVLKMDFLKEIVNCQM